MYKNDSPLLLPEERAMQIKKITKRSFLLFYTIP